MSNEDVRRRPLRRRMGQFAGTIPDRNIVSLGSLPTALLLPPINLVPLALGGMLLARFRPRLGRALSGGALLGLLLLAMPIVSGLLLESLQADVPRGIPDAAGQGVNTADPARLPRAIVVLSADSTHGSSGGILPQPGLGMMTLERVQAGAILARRLSLPVLVTGGPAQPAQPPLAVLMAQAMEQNFSVGVAWIEPLSTDTWENAAFSARMLQASGIRRVYLVTNAWHMRRSLIAFRHFGIDAIPVPSRFSPAPGLDPEAFTPRASAWLNSYFAIHEWVGVAWYWYRDRF